MLTLFILSVFIFPSDSVVRKFTQIDFDQWIDVNNFLVVLFCNTKDDNNCVKELEKLTQLSDEMIKYPDIVFGYITKESDGIILARYNVDKFPMVKLFPYVDYVQTYPLNIRINDLKQLILEKRITILEKRKTDPIFNRKPKPIIIPDIDWLDTPTTIKNPHKHSLLILYDDDCGNPCKIVENVAKIFEKESEVSFYKMSFEKSGPMRDTIPFNRNPSIFWYPKDEKEKGYVYAGNIQHEVLVEFINDKAGLSRDYNGQLKFDAGRILEIDRIIKENIVSILLKTNINSVIHLVETKSKELPHAKKYIDYYIAVLKEIRKGSDSDQILYQEQKYIDNMIKKKTLSASEKDEWRKFYNIVSAFIDFAAMGLKEDLNKRTAVLKEDITFEQQSSYHDEL